MSFEQFGMYRMPSGEHSAASPSVCVLEGSHPQRSMGRSITRSARVMMRVSYCPWEKLARLSTKLRACRKRLPWWPSPVSRVEATRRSLSV
eukprot:778673-Prymnesium_polylepis.1